MPNTYSNFRSETIWRRFLVHSIEIIVIVCMFTPAAVAQTAQLTGTVSDPSGSSVPNAKVTATNVDTGVARASVTNEAGQLPDYCAAPGRYRITAEAHRIQGNERDTVTLAVDQIGTIDFTMEVGADSGKRERAVHRRLLETATARSAMLSRTARLLRYR